MMIFILLFFLALPVLAEAQTPIPLSTAKLSWQWTQGTGGLVEEFHVKCGSSTGSYSKITVLIGSNVRGANVRDVIAGTGNWFCVVTAANAFGESGPSGEVFFYAGGTPSIPTSLEVTQ